MIAEHRIDVLHQPIPVSPKEPSLLHDLGVPVVIGPMNGGMIFPPAFSHRLEGPTERAYLAVARWMSGLMNRLMPGKLRTGVARGK